MVGQIAQPGEVLGAYCRASLDFHCDHSAVALTSLISEVKSSGMWCAAPHATGNRLNGHLGDWASIASASVRAAGDQRNPSQSGCPYAGPGWSASLRRRRAMRRQTER
jgi:hypothetical protein